ncbi:5-formyltetrahydrofolate cyclo-ligase [Mucilaginibacter sp. KACC 22063]|uniref:5-formyltetrahydrofolate cyclo-ligase n=1 Tax=Mucilaginibacter sp. KACC 22063 TaxID=3025666 RepID=UPI00236646C9|nr:5-formyltetrahydrofolate cyclo-ligase [Mucilaginibacter sp. KACC 22063]WDF55341.1 5-formyltetrahydrofolate cyclo-ligase [Mucilaginibacter sp. KACC 22063]
MKKQQAREIYLKKRKELSDADYEMLNRRLLHQFQQVDFSKVKYLHTFIPIRNRREPDTTLISDWLRTTHPQIKLVYPQTNFADLSMQSFVDDADLQMAINDFGISEPVAGNQISADQIDRMLVPLLAFDKQGYRAGYGKGFYDRYMTQCKPACKFIGLSLFEPVDELEDVDQYDIKLHTCVTPDKIHQF